MKKQILKSFVAATFLGLCAIVSVNGQVHRQMKVDVPFDFHVNGKRFSGGQYVIASVNPSSGQWALAFKRVDDKSSQIVFLLPMNLSRNERDNMGLSFHRYGSAYFLSEIRNTMENFAAQSRMSKEEKSLAKQMGTPKLEVIVSTKLQH